MRHTTFLPTLFLASAWLGGCGQEVQPTPRVTLVDVSLLWPLPADDEELSDGPYLLATTQTGSGPLLGRPIFDLVPQLTRVDEPDALYAGLVAVAARLDPCFQEGPGSPPCQPNVRLVLQPVMRGVDGWETRDAAVHAFYSARNVEEVIWAVEKLARERVAVADAAGPLRVHPLLTDIAGRTRVRDILLPLVDAGRLARVASVGVHGANAAWTFSGFDWVNAAPVPIVVPGTGGSTAQHFLSSSAESLEGSVEPPSASADDFSMLLHASALASSPLESKQQAFDAAARIENPTLHNPGTVDCVSCHVTAIARAAATDVGGMERSPQSFASSEHDLSPTPNFTNAQVVRAFGYRFKEPVVSPRVVHESALVADRVHATLRTE